MFASGKQDLSGPELYPIHSLSPSLLADGRLSESFSQAFCSTFNQPFLLHHPARENSWLGVETPILGCFVSITGGSVI